MKAIITAAILFISISVFAQKDSTAKQPAKKDTLPTYNLYQLVLDEQGWKTLLHVISEADEKPSTLQAYITALQSQLKIYEVNPNPKPKDSTATKPFKHQ